jgi:hypothetical protein
MNVVSTQPTLYMLSESTSRTILCDADNTHENCKCAANSMCPKLFSALLACGRFSSHVLKVLKSAKYALGCFDYSGK